MSLFSNLATGCLIDPKDGSLVWYPRGLLYEGYQLAQEQRRKIERRMWVAYGLALMCFVVPVAWLRSHLEAVVGSTGALALLIAAGAAILVVFNDSVYWRPLRIAKAAQRRDPDCRPKDVDWIHKRAQKAENGWPIGYLLLVVAAVLAGDFVKWALSTPLAS